ARVCAAWSSRAPSADWVTGSVRSCPAGRCGGHLAAVRFGLTRVYADRPMAAVLVPSARRLLRNSSSDVLSSTDEPASAARGPRMGSAGRANGVRAAGFGCAAARLICGPDCVAGCEPDGLVPEPELWEEELEPPPELPWPPPPPPPPPPWAPVWLATSRASFLVWARIEAGRGRYPAGSCPG